jgi:hypothetical protein
MNRAIDFDTETRRTILMSFAEGVGLDLLSGALGVAEIEEVDPLELVLQCITLELLAVSIKHEQQTAPAVEAIGAMLAGLFSLDMTEDGKADELLAGLYRAGADLREQALT